MSNAATHLRPAASARAAAQARPSRLAASDEEKLRRRLRRWATRSLGLPDSEFADTYQGAWRKLLEAERRGRPVRNLEHALRWAIHNCWLEECRRRRRRPAVPLGESLETLIQSQAVPDPCEQLERLEAARYLFETAQAIGERAWRVVLLRDVSGLSPAEVCETLGISRRTYRSEHARALNAIYMRLASALGERDCAGLEALRAVARGRASDAQRRAVRGHTRSCVSCRRALAALLRSEPAASSGTHTTAAS